MKKIWIFIVCAGIIFLIWQGLFYTNNAELSESGPDVMQQRLRLFFVSMSVLILIGIVNFGAWIYKVRILKYFLTVIGTIGSLVFWYLTEDYLPPALFAVCSLLGVICFYIKRAQEKRQERIWMHEAGQYFELEDRHN